MGKAEQVNASEQLIEAGIEPMVWSLVYPETRQLRDEFYGDLDNVLPLHELAYQGRGGDDHQRFLDAYREWSEPVIDLGDGFEHGYVTNGSSEAIRHVIYQHIVDCALRGVAPKFHLIEDEYQGYQAYVQSALGDASKEALHFFDRDDFGQIDGDLTEGSRVILSNPSSIDGNFWTDYTAFMGWLADKHPGVPVDVDIAFAGSTTTDNKVDLTHPNVQNVFFSLSKVFGVYRDRTGGLLSREAAPGLYGNRWFNNAQSLAFGMALMARFKPCEIPRRHFEVQAAVVGRARDILEEDIFASDVLLLAHQKSPSMHSDVDERFGRGKGTRLNLSPAIDKILKGDIYEEL